MTAGRRWRVSGALAAAATLLCGASPSHAFLAAGHTVFAPQQSCRNSRCSGTMMSTERDLASPAVVAAAAEVTEPGDEAGASSPTVISTSSDTSSAKGSAATEAGRRWINEMKAGDKVIGYVADTTKFAAFVDCSVVRRGAKVCRRRDVHTYMQQLVQRGVLLPWRFRILWHCCYWVLEVLLLRWAGLSHLVLGSVSV